LLHAAWRYYREPSDLARLGSLLAELRQAVPASKVVVLGALPHWEPTLPQFLLRAGIELDSTAAAQPPAWEELQQVDAALSAVATQHAAVFVSVFRLWCPEQQCPVVAREGDQYMPTLWDDGHLTSAGSELLADRLWPTLAFRPAGPQ
jgi:lysophospholipase L1-like esterase